MRLSLSAALCRSLYLVESAAERERRESSQSREKDEPVSVFLDVVKLALDLLSFTPHHRRCLLYVVQFSTSLRRCKMR